MEAQNKKCPMCAELIPPATAICEYCGTQFEVTIRGYCVNCHALRDANEQGCCKTCGSEIIDRRVESRMIEELREPSPQPTDSAAPIAPAVRKGRAWIWALGAMVFLALAAVLIVYGPRLSAALASGKATPTLPPTSSNTPINSPTRTPPPTITATPVPGWVMDFVYPRLSHITYNAPDFAEDFSNPHRGWQQYEDGAPIRFQPQNGAVQVYVPDNTSVLQHPTVDSLTGGDFAIEMDARVVEGRGAFKAWFHFVQKKNSPLHVTALYVDPTMSKWSLGIFADGIKKAGVDGTGNMSPVGQFTHITIMVAERKVAVLLNEIPVAYLEDPSLDVPAPNFDFDCDGAGTTCEFDNIKVWKLP